MRKKFQPQLQLGTVPVGEINFNLSSRHETTPILMALQYLYVNCQDQLNQILFLIEKDIRQGKNKGCNGMTCWELLVLTALRLGCNYNYDELADIASYHILIRQILMLSGYSNKIYARSTINDNSSLLSPQTIQMISDIIVSIGHALQPDTEPLKKVRGDTFVSKKNIHYPTDSNLLADGIRKIIELCVKIAAVHGIAGWEEVEYLRRKLKKLQRKIGMAARSRSAKRDEELKALYRELMGFAGGIIGKATMTLDELSQKTSGSLSIYWEGFVSELHYFIAGTDYVCKQAHRRIIEGEAVPNPEKVFSLFEPDTELINRGKTPYPIEFGHRVLIIQDDMGFIIHGEVLGQGFTDEKVIVDVMKNLQAGCNGKIKAASFDRGFWTPNNLRELSAFIPLVVLPKKGKLSGADKIREGAEEFGTIRKWHPGVESAIHALVAGNGLAVCRDKGSTGYKRYVATAILGRNLHNFGVILMKKLKKKRSEEDLLMNLIL